MMAYMVGYPPEGSDDPEDEDYSRAAEDYWNWYNAMEQRGY